MQNRKSSLSVTDLCYIALFTALIAVLAQISIPLPGGVPLTLQTLAVPLAGIVLGPRRGTFSTLLYVLLGAIGIPVFANFTGGLGIVLGVTGGFIISLSGSLDVAHTRRARQLRGRHSMVYVRRGP